MQPLRSVFWARPAWLTGLTLPVAISLALLAPGTAYANVGLTRVSHDIYSDTQAQHATEVEPDVYASGNTIVSAFQVGRVSGGGASDLGWATSTDGGTTWTNGTLSGITVNQGGTFSAASDAAVAQQRSHAVSPAVR